MFCFVNTICFDLSVLKVTFHFLDQRDIFFRSSLRILLVTSVDFPLASNVVSSANILVTPVKKMKILTMKSFLMR